MLKQIIFIIIIILTLGIFIYSVSKYFRYLSFLKKAYPIKDIYKRLMMTLDVAIFQSKILRRPVIGFIHAMVFWGFIIICFGSLEMIIDGIFGTDRIFSGLPFLYNILSASCDIFGLIVFIAIIVFICRRLFMNIKRFSGLEMKHWFHTDAIIALTFILLLMITLLGMNAAYMALTPPSDIKGIYPVSNMFAGQSSIFNCQLSIVHCQLIFNFCWWSHLLLIFVFANYLPYSKHFHVFMSVPNVFLSKLEPMAKMTNMDNITKEVKMMLNPETAFAASHCH